MKDLKALHLKPTLQQVSKELVLNLKPFQGIGETPATVFKRTI